MTCRKVAQAIMNHQTNGISQHLHFDLHHFYNQIPANQNATLFAIRTENLWQDFIKIKKLLGQAPGTVAINENIARDSTNIAMPISAGIGDLGRSHLCSSPFLQREYNTYFRILHQAVNIHTDDVREMHEAARKNCPSLDSAKLLQIISGSLTTNHSC